MMNPGVFSLPGIERMSRATVMNNGTPPIREAGDNDLILRFYLVVGRATNVSHPILVVIVGRAKQRFPHDYCSHGGSC